MNKQKARKPNYLEVHYGIKPSKTWSCKTKNCCHKIEFGKYCEDCKFDMIISWEK